MSTQYPTPLTPGSPYPTLAKVVMSKGYASIDQEEKIKIQDEIGRAILSDVVAWGRALPDDQRRLFVWAVFTCMGYEVAVAIAKETVLRPILEDDEATLLNTHKEAMNRVRAREEALDVQLAQRDGRIEELAKQNAALLSMLDAAKKQADDYGQAVYELRIQHSQDVAEIARLRKIEDAVKLLKSL